MTRYLIILILSLSQLVSAQTDFRPGFIVLNNGDTLTGEIDYRGDMSMKYLCRFKSPSDSVLVFTPEEIKEYRYLNGKYYISKNIEGGQHLFLEYLIKGKLNIFYYKDKNGNHYLIEKDDIPIREIPYKEKLLSENEGTYLYKSSGHIGLLRYATRDAPVLQSEINKIGKPEHENLIKLARDYQNIVCRDEACIVYEKKGPLLEFNIVPVFGFVKYSGIKKMIPETGALLFIWIPRVNERLYLKTGLTYHYLKIPAATFSNYFGSVYKIPLQLQYLFPGQGIRPRFIVGSNMYIIHKENNAVESTFQIGSGIVAKINKRIDFVTDLYMESMPVAVFLINRITDSGGTGYKIYSFSFDLGLNIKL